jgi:MFS family permease
MSDLMGKRLFFIANLSIFMIGMGFAVRANIAIDLQLELFDAIDSANSATMVGQALGSTFTGFAFTLLFGSAIVDYIGSRQMIIFSALSYLVGSSLVIIASFQQPSWSVYYQVLTGLLFTGLGWGAVEAAINPVVASIDPKNKVKRLNILHAWWPAGIVVGGLLGVLLESLNILWQVNLLILIIPSILLLVLTLKVEFPKTERVLAGVSYSDMFKELYRKPQFFIFWGCMWLTTTSELAPGQWVDLALSNIVGFSGILILVYVSSLMFVMRHFAGSIVKKTSTIGLLWISSLLAAIGLYGLSIAHGPISAFVASTIWGIGVCYMWPTMIATVSERFPKGGALFMGLMGFGGGMAIQFALPKLGAIFDKAKLEATGSLEKIAQLSGEELAEVQKIASAESFQALVYVPILLLPIFGGIWLYDRRK